MGYEGDVLRAHKVEPHVVWGQEILLKSHVILAALTGNQTLTS